MVDEVYRLGEATSEDQKVGSTSAHHEPSTKQDIILVEDE